MWISTSTGLCYPVRLWLVGQCIISYLLSILPWLTCVFVLIELAQAWHPRESINTQLLSQALLPRELGIDTRLFLCLSLRFTISWGTLRVLFSQPTFCLEDSSTLTIWIIEDFQISIPGSSPELQNQGSSRRHYLKAIVFHTQHV